MRFGYQRESEANCAIYEMESSGGQQFEELSVLLIMSPCICLKRLCVSMIKIKGRVQVTER